MMWVFILGFVVFVVTLALGEQSREVHVNDVYPALSFFAAAVVAVLGFLLKWLVTRDRNSLDIQIAAIEERLEKERKETRGFIDGLGIKVEHLADVVDEKVSEAVEELRRHDRELFLKFDAINREFGQLKGEHDTLKYLHHRRVSGKECP